MKKLLIISIIIIFFILILVRFYSQQELKISKEPSSEELLENLGSIILANTKFKDFSIDRFSFKYPNWKKIEIDPLLIWPKEIAEKQEILLYLTNSDGVKILVTKRELTPKDLTKPYPLIFREIFTKEREIMEKEGGLTNLQIIREEFFENGILLESKMIIFGQSVTSISKSIILRLQPTRHPPASDAGPSGQGFIYSVGISAKEQIFEDYRPLAHYIIDSIRYY
ncbi:hypothetical protein KJA16_02600 [Patescibacteria group bacterium]|nr:hypothetical protein [Patescibacteria group bacterium]